MSLVVNESRCSSTVLENASVSQSGGLDARMHRVNLNQSRVAQLAEIMAHTSYVHERPVRSVTATEFGA